MSNLEDSCLIKLCEEASLGDPHRNVSCNVSAWTHSISAVGFKLRFSPHFLPVLCCSSIEARHPIYLNPIPQTRLVGLFYLSLVTVELPSDHWSVWLWSLTDSASWLNLRPLSSPWKGSELLSELAYHHWTWSAQLAWVWWEYLPIRWRATASVCLVITLGFWLPFSCRATCPFCSLTGPSWNTWVLLVYYWNNEFTY